MTLEAQLDRDLGGRSRLGGGGGGDDEGRRRGIVVAGYDERTTKPATSSG